MSGQLYDSSKPPLSTNATIMGGKEPRLWVAEDDEATYIVRGFDDDDLDRLVPDWSWSAQIAVTDEPQIIYRHGPKGPHREAQE